LAAISSKLVAIAKATTATKLFPLPTLNASPQCAGGRGDDGNSKQQRRHTTTASNKDYDKQRNNQHGPLSSAPMAVEMTTRMKLRGQRQSQEDNNKDYDK